jgi:sucrose-phosphate synthase
MTKNTQDGLYVALFSIHGLMRGQDLELGRDADTGGQTKYVVELARALAERPEVARLDLFTRRVVDGKVGPDYSVPEEPLGNNAWIIRLEAGPDAYIPKEELWDHLDAFADNTIDYFRATDLTPDILHSHYADAGFVGVRIARRLGRPLVHTGHSLGRVKRRRLLASGVEPNEVETRYSMSRRVEAEEDTLATAELVIASTHNEVEEQYGLYDHYQPERMAVIPPGTDLERFRPPTGGETNTALHDQLARFLTAPDRPMILAVSRADQRKNVASLVRAYGESPELQRIANLVVAVGNREDIRDLESGAREVLHELLLLIDYYDLYGRVAYPKQLGPDDVPELYRMAALTKGVFVNPALTEPFGLTLLEAAASGLPLVATEDGGPRDIIGNCDNGVLIDPLDTEGMAKALLHALSDDKEWRRFSENGLKGVQTHYSWQAHAERYITRLRPVLRAAQHRPAGELPGHPRLFPDRALVVELDHALLGDPEGLEAFVALLRQKRRHVGFGIATGRGLEGALRLLRQNGVPLPDVLITGMGTELYYTPQLMADIFWNQHIDHQWNPKALRRILGGLPGLQLRPKSEQLRFKLTYEIDPAQAPSVEEINRLLRQQDEAVNLFSSSDRRLDVTPARASKGFALRYFADHWGIALERILVAGSSASDEDMMRGNPLSAVIAGPHAGELSYLAEVERVYFSKGRHARGIAEAIDHYDFFGECRKRDESSNPKSLRS